MNENQKSVSLFDEETLNDSVTFAERTIGRLDGLYRPLPKNAIDKSKGYCATIRFLPNITDDMKMGHSIIEKAVHYANLPNEYDLSGYYDSLTNFGEKCPLTTLYWRLKKSDNAVDNERSKTINKTTKYYSYIVIVEDEQHPEFVGKIMAYPYGFKIKEKIQNEKEGKNPDDKKCNIFDPANGKDFCLVVKEVAGFPNYDNSYFKTASPVKIWNADGKKITLPVVFDENKQRNKITNKKSETALVEFLHTRTMKLEDNAPQRWSADEQRKVNDIVAVLSGKRPTAPISVDTSKTDDNDESLDAFFGEMKDD